MRSETSVLIKICGGAQLNDLKTNVAIGSSFLRYLLPDVYDRGNVTAFDGKTITVDFTDTIRSFAVEDVTLVFGGVHGEHLMSKADGSIHADFRQTHKDSPLIDNLEDLLDFDKWLG